jgi:uncharacterized protein (UPF0333 family)
MGVNMIDLIINIRHFISEEEAQASIEYFLMVGSIMVAAVLIFSSYYKLGSSGAMKFNESVYRTGEIVCDYVEDHLESPGIC